MPGGGCAVLRGLQNSIISPAGVVLAAVAIMVGGTLCCAAQADNADISMRRASERTSFSNCKIKKIAASLKTGFHAELEFDRRSERIRKFDEPVRVFVIVAGRRIAVPRSRRSSPTSMPMWTISIWR